MRWYNPENMVDFTQTQATMQQMYFDLRIFYIKVFLARQNLLHPFCHRVCKESVGAKNWGSKKLSTSHNMTDALNFSIYFWKILIPGRPKNLKLRCKPKEGPVDCKRSSSEEMAKREPMNVPSSRYHNCMMSGNGPILSSS